MMGIFEVEGASPESRCDSLGITTGRALSKRASSGPASFDPATLSPCETWFGWVRWLLWGGKGTKGKGEHCGFWGLFLRWDGVG